MHYRIAFNPLVYASQSDADTLRQWFGVQGVDSTFEVSAYRQPYRVPKGIIDPYREVVWALEMPLGAFVGVFCGVDLYAHINERDRLIQAARDHYEASHALLAKRRDYFIKDGIPCYRRLALEHLRPFIEKPAFVNAVIAFLRAAESNPTIITGAPKPRRPHRTVDERVEHFGAACKGPMWTAEEDAVLRMWFGLRSLGEHAGHHAKLSDEEWTRVLELLGGLRSKNAVKNRLTILNNQLRDRMLVNGFMPRDRLREYMKQALGEAPRRPPMRPYPRMRRTPRENRSTRRRNDAPASREVAPTSTMQAAQLSNEATE